MLHTIEIFFMIANFLLYNKSISTFIFSIQPPMYYRIFEFLMKKRFVLSLFLKNLNNTVFDVILDFFQLKLVRDIGFLLTDFTYYFQVLLK